MSMFLDGIDIDRWYGGGIRIPSPASYRYKTFLSNSIGIVRSVFRRKTGTTLSIKFMRATKKFAAYADPENGLIVISDDLLKGHFPGLNGSYQLEGHQITEAILGLIVHEAAHFARSPRTLVPFQQYVKKNCKAVYNEEIASSLANTLEDIYIEAWVDRELPNLSWMLLASARAFFLPKDVKQIESIAKKIRRAPRNPQQLQWILNCLLLAKVQDWINAGSYVNDLFEMALSIREMDSLKERFDLLVKLYDILMTKIDMEQEGKGKGEGEDGEGEDEATDVVIVVSDGEGKGGREMKIKDLPESVQKTIEKIVESSDIIRHLDKLHEEMRPSPSTDVNALNEELRTGEKNEIELVESDYHTRYEDGEKETVMYVEKPVEQYSEAVEADQKYNRLAELARQRAVVNRPYGQPQRRGNSIRNLYRIGTDQKIFSQPLPVVNYKPMQVLILIDCSGSMAGEDISKAVQAGLGAATALSEARCDVAVYGHTAQVNNNDSVEIYVFKKFTESMDGLGRKMRRFYMGSEGVDRLYDFNYRLFQNKDGFAIARMTDKFTSYTKRRVMIVISDGAPYAQGYSGWSAVEHTKGKVEAARKRGIEVLSISINESANEVNDQIYGERWNVFNEDPNVIEQIVKALLLE